MRARPLTYLIYGHVGENFGSLYNCVMSRKHVFASRVLKQLTVSDRLLILLKLCMSECARVCLVMKVKADLILCDIRE